MRIELCRMIAACLSDGTTGTNAQLSTLSLDGGDVVPRNVASILNPADNNVSLREADTTFPVLVVDLRDPIQMQGYAMTGVRDGVAQIKVTYLTESGDSAKNYRDADYSLRASTKAIHAKLWTGDGSDTARKRNSIAIKNSPTMTITPTDQGYGAGVAVAALNITANVRDLSV